VKRIIKKFLSLLGLEVRFKSNDPADKFIRRFNYKTVSRLLCFERLFNKISDIDGDVVECGVGNARDLVMLACFIEQERKNRTLWGFDSFEGFPEPTQEDKSTRNPKKGEWKVMEQEMVSKILARAYIDENFIHSGIKIVKGFFDESLPRSEVQNIAFLHLDVDLYESYKTCLKELFPRVVRGGVILFDEYGDTVKFPGAKKAIDEYFKNTSYTILQEAIYGKYYVIKH